MEPLMDSGRILVGDHDGVYVIKFVGDVRVTLCATMDAFLRGLLEREDFRSVIVDLQETSGIDSTSLGLLAKLSLETQRRFGVVPTLVSTNPDITRVLTAMGFGDVFHILESPLTETGQLGELPRIESDEEAMRQRVIDAHRTLMQLNESNRNCFRDLVLALEGGAAA
ncbi:MAG: STAS domain-containing protein [Pseudomonadales bacterium]|jgi:anti-anti-sigma factor|nr:STAS domain-containing protein [Pseudomonadales bacterium]